MHDTLRTDVIEPGKLTGSTRRTFIRDLAAAGTSTAVAMYGVDEAGLLVAEAAAADELAPLSEFTAIGPSLADAFEVPSGFSWQVVIAWGDKFANTDGTEYTYGYNNDFLAYFPLKGSDEGILFVNHEYPDPFYQHSFKPLASANTPRANSKTTKSRADIDAEKEATGNSIVHVRRTATGAWAVVTPSPYNRRIYGGTVTGKAATPLSFTGPLARAGAQGSSAPDPKVHGADNTATGTIGNCSGGITPWGTALSCEENYDGYGISFRNSTLDFTYGWDSVDPAKPLTEQQDGSYVPPSAAASEYEPTTNGPVETRKYGWVCEHDPYTNTPGRKHTALGRFRHENTAFRAARDKKFTLYMGDDQADQAIYKFVSALAYDASGTPAARENNLKILTAGKLYVARFAPEGLRRFASGTSTTPLSATSGTGQWVLVATDDLFDTRLRLGGYTTNASPSRRPKQGTNAGDADPASPNFAGRYNRDVPGPEGTPVNEWLQFFATNRPEDVEVTRDGTVYVALTNNSRVNDSYGSIRRMVEAGNDPEATTFVWDDFAAGGQKPYRPTGEQGFASPDNLVFDADQNIWIVTDISSGSIGNATYGFHGNNAVFMIPRGDSGVAFRFANMPVQSEGTGPYFTPDESTLWVNVQHPGENAKLSETAILGQPATFPSYWPAGNKTTNTNPSTPRPATVAIFRSRTQGQVPTPTPVPPGNVPSQPDPRDVVPPNVTLPKKIGPLTLKQLIAGFKLPIEVDEATILNVRITGKVRYRDSRGRRRITKSKVLARVRKSTRDAGTFRLELRPDAATRKLLKRDGAKVVEARVIVTAEDRAGNQARRISRQVKIG